MYRGNNLSGSLDKTDLPETWDVKTGENLIWKKEIPGLGLSSPVIWDDLLFITTAVSEKDDEGLKAGIYGSIGSVNDESIHEWKVICLNKLTGEIVWEKTAHRGIPEQKRHPKSTHANSTAATDGQYIVAFFGSEGLYCYDFDGNLIWEKDFGKLKSVFFAVESAEWEFASSPVIYDGRVIIQCDVKDNSFIASFELASGRELWKTARDEYPGWSTPAIYFNDNKPYVAVNGYKHRGGYDFDTGEEIWWMSGGGDIPIPSPVTGYNLIFFNSAHGPKSPVMAVSVQAKGEVNMPYTDDSGEPYIKWIKPRDGSYMQTMLLYDDLLYNLKWNGTLQCYKPLTGELVYEEKLGRAESFTASPVASDGRIFIVNDEGKVYIIQSCKEFKILAENMLNGVSMVSPAITDQIIYFRTEKYLIAVSNQ